MIRIKPALCALMIGLAIVGCDQRARDEVSAAGRSVSEAASETGRSVADASAEAAEALKRKAQDAARELNQKSARLLNN